MYSLVLSPISLFQENTFQVVMAVGDQFSFITFLYDDIQWTDGGRAAAGINGGDGVRFLNLPVSRSSDNRAYTTNSNVGVDGVWMYRVDYSRIIHPGFS